MNKHTLRNTLILIVASVVLAGGIYCLDLWFLPHPKISISPTDAAFFEGILFILMGVICLVGSGGFSPASGKAAMLAATANAIFGEGTIGPSEVFKKEAWKPEGTLALAIIFITAGIILLIIYFTSIY